MQLHEIMHIWKEGRTGERDKQILQTEVEGEEGCCQISVQRNNCRRRGWIWSGYSVDIVRRNR